MCFFLPASRLIRLGNATRVCRWGQCERSIIGNTRQRCVSSAGYECTISLVSTFDGSPCSSWLLLSRSIRFGRPGQYTSAQPLHDHLSSNIHEAPYPVIAAILHPYAPHKSNPAPIAYTVTIVAVPDTSVALALSNYPNTSASGCRTA